MERTEDDSARANEGEVRKPDIEAILRDGRAIDRALQRAVREAIRMHKLLGNPIAVSRNGEVVWIPPEEIPDDLESSEEATR